MKATRPNRTNLKNEEQNSCVRADNELAMYLVNLKLRLIIFISTFVYKYRDCDANQWAVAIQGW